MHVKENKAFTKDYFDPSKRYIGNSIQIEFNDGKKTDKVSIDYPVGHKEERKAFQSLRKSLRRVFRTNYTRSSGINWRTYAQTENN